MGSEIWGPWLEVGNNKLTTDHRSQTSDHRTQASE